MKPFKILISAACCSALLLLTSCNKDDDKQVVAIGDSYQGGKVAYLFQPGDPGYDAAVQHGLIAASSDHSAGIVWWNGTYTTTGATATSLGTGNANTTTIVNNQGAGNYAAKVCDDLSLGGFTDWYLPTRDELNKLYESRAAIGGFSNDVANSTYWSSSEVVALTPPNAGVFEQTFSTGQIGQSNKENIRLVRAVRSF